MSKHSKFHAMKRCVMSAATTMQDVKSLSDDAIYDVESDLESALKLLKEIRHHEDERAAIAVDADDMGEAS